MFDFLFNTNGRISRKGYLLGYIVPYIGLTELLPRLLGGVGIPGIGILFFLLWLFFLWPGLVAVPVRRFHDMGLTGWYHAGVVVLMIVAGMIVGQGMFQQIGAAELEALQLMSPEQQQAQLMEAYKESGRAQLGSMLFAGVAIAEFLLFAIKPGQVGPNKFGNDPLADGRGFAD